MLKHAFSNPIFHGHWPGFGGAGAFRFFLLVRVRVFEGMDPSPLFVTELVGDRSRVGTVFLTDRSCCLLGGIFSDGCRTVTAAVTPGWTFWASWELPGDSNGDMFPSSKPLDRELPLECCFTLVSTVTVTWPKCSPLTASILVGGGGGAWRFFLAGLVGGLAPESSVIWLVDCGSTAECGRVCLAGGGWLTIASSWAGATETGRVGCVVDGWEL